MSRVSSAVRRCFHSGITDSVRMLCSRSASFMTSTLQSLAIATSILRIVAACCASFESKRSRSNLVTPSTIAATAGPNSAAIWARVTPVSSTASCSSAAAALTVSRPSSAMIVATATGWVMYGSPESRRWDSCALVARTCARRTRSRSSPGRRTLRIARMPSTSAVGGGMRARAGFSGDASAGSPVDPESTGSTADMR